MRRDDTIFALASGSGTAAIAIVRLAGPRTAEVIAALAGALPAPRRAALRTLRDPGTGLALDQALVLSFPAPASFTGDDAGELHIHGGAAVKAALVGALVRLGLRPAEPGEFTRRAFLNGRLDLAEAEGLADLLAATTERQRRQAFRQLTGALGEEVARWRGALLEAAARLEAAIDFADEGDVPAADAARVLALTSPVAAALTRALAQTGGERLREGWVVALAGPPNAGKSTLLNHLAGREAAIVSPLPGTTRDTIEIGLDLDGYPFTLIDTAGLRDSTDPVEQIGMSRARAAADRADLVVWLDDGRPDPMPAPGPGVVLRIRSKSDLPGPTPDGTLAVSATTGAGIDALKQRLVAFAAAQTGDEAAVITQARHRQAFAAAQAALARLPASLETAVELAAEDLRIATRALQTIIGSIDVEDVLGEIFGRFCIGK